jgi:molybdopterin-guanine dinucleotide biosynthesis protein A
MPLSEDVPVGVVLAGGASRRMGRDKALLRPAGGATLLESAVAALRAAGLAEIAVSVSSVSRADALRAAVPALHSLPRVVDLMPGCGPLGALHATLCAYPGRSVVLVACDMPHLDPAALRALVTAGGDADVVVPHVAGRDQPLHALYGPACVGIAARLLGTGERAMRTLLTAPELRVRVLDEAWLAGHGVEAAAFENLNTPDELAAAGYG